MNTIKARLQEELNVIYDRGFSKYFLTMKAIIDLAKMIVEMTGSKSELIYDEL